MGESKFCRTVKAIEVYSSVSTNGQIKTCSMYTQEYNQLKNGGNSGICNNEDEAKAC